MSARTPAFAFLLGLFLLVAGCSAGQQEAPSAAGAPALGGESRSTGTPPVTTSSTVAPPTETTATSAPAVTPPCTAARTAACVSLSENKAWLMRDGEVTHGPVPITSGKPGHPTPVGVFQVEWKDKDHVSGEFDNAPMPNSVFFAPGGIAFHGGSLEELSHGCIHLSQADSERFFAALGVGAVVQIVR